MELEEKAEEILETLWIRTEEKEEGAVALDNLGIKGKRPIDQLLKGDYISISGDRRVRLTETGRPEARNVVRRHRLAERLLADVLGTRDMLIHEKACKFEHLLDRGLDENICVLLGHPKVCPHGKSIPSGGCCQREQTQTSKVVAPLSQLTRGQKGRVAYIYTLESDKLQTLLSMGILPGTPVSLVQSFPSFVLQTHQTQFSVDKGIAEAIYVRLVATETNN